MGASYASVFDSEDEFESSSSGSGGSGGNSPLFFNKRPITPTPPSRSSSTEVKKPVSLLTLALARSRATVALTTSDDEEEFASSDSEDDDASDTSSIYLPISQRVLMDLPSPSLRSASDTLADALAELEQPTTRHTGIMATIKKAITTNLKWCVKITTSLRCKNQASKNSMSSTTSLLLPPQQKNTYTIPDDEEDEEQDANDFEAEVNPNHLFFGTNNNQHNNRISPPPGLDRGQRPRRRRPIPPPLQLHPSSDWAPATPALAIPPSQEQSEQQREEIKLTIEARTAWTNDQLQVRRAGPLEVVDSAVAYIPEQDRDRDWVCCGCCNVNSRYEFLCWWCKGHVKGGCCEEAVEGVDGVAGWGVGGVW
ncbi:hypothetical protein C8A01DRAFT_36637 [Parachaetomium inaequale]|uniref:RanBP2-type domain-containing protein n=1 Tax=Parachaetomium inaequale TaxID=2588326 RepID=A0AAN6PHL9_9PEZI|nr:hypothetical protein C8A01DRAFT_36637 [Parachaetomium inaequale]